MKKIQYVSQRNGQIGLQERQVKRLIVNPIAAEVKNLRKEMLNLAGVIIKKVTEVDASISIVAREIKRQRESAE